MFAVGQRVRHTTSGETGYVLDIQNQEGGAVYRVGFSSGEWPIRAEFLEAADAPKSDFERLASAQRGYPYETELKRRALSLTDAYRNDPLAVLSNSRVEPQPHQLAVLMRVIEKTRPRMILADEVGLGKTIEAGLVLKELRARGSAERVLILTPASLQTQWLYELRSKFNEDFQVFDGAYLRHLRQYRPDQNPFSVHPSVICSVQLARGESCREDIVAADWDLVVVDEAHHARNWWNNGEPRPNLAFELLEELRDRTNGLLLLTATPMQLHEFELFSLVSLAEPGLFESFADFQAHRWQIRDINDFVRALTDGPLGYPRQVQLVDLMRRLNAPPELMRSSLATQAEREKVSRWLERQHRLSAALVRNRRAQIGGFVKREARRIPVQPSHEELALEAHVSRYITSRYSRERGARGMAVGLVLVTFQKLACSSSRALRHALVNRRARLRSQLAEVEMDDPELAEELEEALAGNGTQEELAQLDALIDLASRVSDSKLVALRETLVDVLRSNPDEKAVVFTQFLETLEMIRGALEGVGISVATFSGKLTSREKDEAVRTFRESAQVLVTSEAGGEGRNFQFCHILFNYDLPWNPMRIEQRIGRLDRFGQRRNVLAYNFAVRSTLDERILDVLDRRIRVFTESVGALEPILGEVENDLKQLCLQDVEDAKRAVKQYEVDLETKLQRARQADDATRELLMDMRAYRRDEAATLLGKLPEATREDLSAFVVMFLNRYPTARSETPSPGLFFFRLPQTLLRAHRELIEEYRGTFDYRLALLDERLEFFAFGHPLVDAAIAECLNPAFAPSPGVLVGSNAEESAAIVEYELRLRGVRDETRVISHCASGRAVSGVPQIQTTAGPNDEISYGDWPAEYASRIETRSRSAADEAAQAAFLRFRDENRALLTEERLRLRKRFAFQRSSYVERIERNQRLIDEAVALGSADARSVGARRGYVTRDRRRLEALSLEEARAEAELERRSEPTLEVRLVHVAELTQQGA